MFGGRWVHVGIGLLALLVVAYGVGRETPPPVVAEQIESVVSDYFVRNSIVLDQAQIPEEVRP